MSSKSRQQSQSQTTGATDQARAPDMQDRMGNAAMAELFDQGAAGRGSDLPFLDELQLAFGTDLAHVRAHLGTPQAVQALDAIGADGAAKGNVVLFRSPNPDKELVSHEATHVVQQSNEVQTEGGTGGSEQQADAVAAQVASGKAAGPVSSAPLGVHRRRRRNKAAPAAEDHGAVAGLEQTRQDIAYQRKAEDKIKMLLNAEAVKRLTGVMMMNTDAMVVFATWSRSQNKIEQNSILELFVKQAFSGITAILGAGMAPASGCAVAAHLVGQIISTVVGAGEAAIGKEVKNSVDWDGIATRIVGMRAAANQSLRQTPAYKDFSTALYQSAPRLHLDTLDRLRKLFPSRDNPGGSSLTVANESIGKFLDDCGLRSTTSHMQTKVLAELMFQFKKAVLKEEADKYDVLPGWADVNPFASKGVGDIVAGGKREDALDTRLRGKSWTEAHKLVGNKKN